MKTRRFLVVVMWLFASAAPVWGDDHAAAVSSLRNRVAQGEAEAQFALGFIYFQGEVVPQDYAQALKWYRLAAAQGDAIAQNNLGAIYGSGRGVPQDSVQAYKWYYLAAATFTTNPQHDNAVKACNSLATRMTPAQIAEAQKLAREWKKQ